MRIEKLQRFLGNTHTLEVHDTDNEEVNCELDEISVAHRRWYETLYEAKQDLDYDNCAHRGLDAMTGAAAWIA
jgi:hypothetical protein